ncbi:MAG TPA: AsmA family protein, partial [Steroidobacteraceae bacterium]|nr:AsmA family protein [Steroidobacteraceae bacterium]
MRLTRPLKITIAALALVVLAAAAILWILGRTPFVRDKVAAWVTEATGLPATLDAVSIGLLRGPFFELHGLAIAQPPGFGDKPLVEVGSARVTAPWSSLWGDPVAHSLTVDKAVLRPAVAADGSDNWTGVIERLTADDDEATTPAWAVGRLDVRKGAIEYEDAASGTRFRLTAITIGAADVSLAADFPVDLQVAGVSGTSTFLIACDGRGLADPGGGRFAATGLNLRGWAGGEPLPLAGVEFLGKIKTVTFDSTAGVAAIDGGSFNLAGIPGEFAGSVHLGEPDETL